jgi:O-antigen ligase
MWFLRIHTSETNSPGLKWIIDIVNTYLGTALNYGLIGLFLFVSFILIGLTKAYLRAKEVSHSDPDLALLGSSLTACIVGTLVMIDSNSFTLGCPKVFYVLAGLAIAYARMPGSPQHRPIEPSANNALQE